MLDAISNEVFTILTTSVCGVSLTSIIGMVIYAIRLSVKNKKNLQITTETIEEAFKNVVLPKNIKLDISNKIEKPIKEGLLELSERVNGTLSRVEEGEKMMLQILTLFTHFQKLPDDVREQIEDFINEDALSMDAKL